MSLFDIGVAPALDANGDPISGAVWQFTLYGTTTPTPAYSDEDLDTSLGATVTSDAAGRFVDIYLDDSIPTRARLWPDGTLTGSPIKDIALVNASSSAAYLTYLQAGDDAVPRTVQDRLRDEVFAKDFGVVADGTTDDAAAMQAAIDFAEGREIVLPAGTIRCASGLADHRIANNQTDDLPGLHMRGEGTLSTIIEFDYNGDYGISVRGTDDVISKFQKGGGLSDLTLRPADGRTIEAGLRIVGWWLAEHTAVDFGGFAGVGDRRGFTYGVYFPIVGPTAGGSYANPDYYQSTSHSWKGCSFRCNTTGILAETGQGSATQVFENCVLTHNLEHGAQLHGSGWKFSSGAIAYNGLGGVIGYGVYVDATSSSVSNITIDHCEIDSNLTAGLYLGFVLAARVENNRFISKRMEDINAVSRDFQPTHVLFPSSLITTLRAMDNSHRVDTIGFADPVQGTVTLYDGGTGSANIRGCEITGVGVGGLSGFISGTITNGSPTVTGVSASAFNGLQVGQAVKSTSQYVPYGTTIQALDSGAGTITMTANATSTPGVPVSLLIEVEHVIASAGLLNPRYHNFVRLSTGMPRSSRRVDMALTGTSTQAFTNSAAPWIFTLEQMGFTESGVVDPWYESATGGIRVQHVGKTRVRVRFTITAFLTGDTVTVRLNKNGSLVTGETVTIAPTVSLGAAPYELTFTADHTIGDLLQLEIIDTNAIGTAGHAVSGNSRFWAEAL